MRDLFVYAGGRCEFDGCNEFLLEHPLTHTAGNYAQMAHIVAYRGDGPRGQEDRPSDINDISNLMLLCPKCHKLVDDNPETWTRTVLEDHKRAHEERVHHLTSLGPNRSTSVLICMARVRGDTVSVPFEDVVTATSPRYPQSRRPRLVDLTSISDEHNGFLEVACQQIDRELSDYLRQGGEAETSQHISLFAFAPMPLLIYLGWKLGNKIPLDLFQRHRDTEDWVWKAVGSSVDYTFSRIQEGRADQVAIVLSLSGTIPMAALPEHVRESTTIYELTLKEGQPRTTFLQTAADLERFRSVYQELLAHIVGAHGLIDAVDLFPAVPLPIAVLCGRELLPKVHPSLNVYDYDKSLGGFNYQLTVNK